MCLFCSKNLFVICFYCFVIVEMVEVGEEADAWVINMEV